MSPPDPSGVSRLLALADVNEPELGVFLRLAASTGARRGELCALRWRYMPCRCSAAEALNTDRPVAAACEVVLVEDAHVFS